MFRSFFLSRRWLFWAWGGLLLIFLGTWFGVDIDKQINTWFGSFYDFIQALLSGGHPVDATNKFYGLLIEFASLAGAGMLLAVGLSFFTKHWVFRWREAMNDFYMRFWPVLRQVEGASQRVQEDTKRFAALMESLGSSFLDSIMTLIVFLPLLWEMSRNIKEVPFFGALDHALVFAALLSAIFGTVVLSIVGLKLPGLEFNNQKVEAAYRKELVYGEDEPNRASQPVVKELFAEVRKNYFRLFLHYLYFDATKYSYLQMSVLVPYVVMIPTLIAGAITLGIMQQVVRAFDRVQSSFQFLVRSWSVVVELISVYKRLRLFESQIDLHSDSSSN